MTVLVASPMSSALTKEMAARYEIVGLDSPFADAIGRLPASVRDAVDAIVALGIERLDAAALALFPRLGMIVCLGSGYDGIDMNAAASRGITIAHSPGANAASVADVAIALVIECVRDI